MAYRFVRARPRRDRMVDLRERLDSGEIEAMEPFGLAMTTALEDARIDADTGNALWVEEDYCSPPLAMERDVLAEYFESITVLEEAVDEEEGWERLEDLPLLWDELALES
ncbi:hypothetical protein ACYJ1Y_07960 [Natrialbaceae archaeon A-gly3]